MSAAAPGTVDAGDVEKTLPRGWSVEQLRPDMVRAESPDGDYVFTIEHTGGELFECVWFEEPPEVPRGLEPCGHTEGVRERCIVWAAGEAKEAEADNEVPVDNDDAVVHWLDNASAQEVLDAFAAHRLDGELMHEGELDPLALDEDGGGWDGSELFTRMFEGRSPETPNQSLYDDLLHRARR